MGGGPVSQLFPKSFDLTGRWRVIHHVERSALKRYIGLEIEFDVTLAQDGDTLTGSGAKFIADYMIVPKSEGSTLDLHGRIDGERVTIDLVERAARHPDRSIVGQIAWTVVTPNMLSGTFRSGAAESSGTSRALRR